MSGASESPFDLNGRVAFVTGGAHDIGRAIAVALARAGADVFITYLKSSEAATATVNDIRSFGSRAHAMPYDAYDTEAPARLAAAALEFGDGRVDVLVNNAGGDIREARLKTVDVELINQTFALNFTPAIMFCKELVPHMIDNGFGRVISISSVAAATGGKAGDHHYAAAKAAVASLARSLTNEFGRTGITFNTLSPGFVENGFHGSKSREQLEAMAKRIPAGRTGTNEDIGGAVVFLASNEASWITGECLHVNGGMYFGR